MEGRADEAVREYKIALQINPNFVGGHVNIAVTLAQQGKKDEAAMHFRKALELDPSNAQARTELEKLDRK